MVDSGLGKRLLDGPLRVSTDSLFPGDRRVRFSPSRALSTYFLDTPRQFSGSLFDFFGGGGDRPDVANQITREDMLAVAAVNGAMPACVAEQLLSEPASGRIAAWLLQLPTDIDLWDADDETLAVGTEAWAEIRAIHEACTATEGGWVVANKMLARKRPRLIPQYDAKVRRVVDLDGGASWWFSLRDALGSDGEDNEIRYRVGAAMRDAGVRYISVLRGLDVILWSYANFGERTQA